MSPLKFVPRSSEVLSRSRFLGVLIALLTFASSPAFALKSDRLQVMDLQAQRWSGVMSTGVQTWSGAVRITQGSLKILADKATLKYKDGGVETAELQGNSGKLASVQQNLDGGGQVLAQAKSVHYDLARNQVTLSGTVRIEQNGNVTEGERFVYSLDTGALEGDGGGGQVRLRLQPKSAPTVTAPVVNEAPSQAEKTP